MKYLISFSLFVTITTVCLSSKSTTTVNGLAFSSAAVHHRGGVGAFVTTSITSDLNNHNQWKTKQSTRSKNNNKSGSSKKTSMAGKLCELAMIQAKSDIQNSLTKFGGGVSNKNQRNNNKSVFFFQPYIMAGIVQFVFEIGMERSVLKYVPTNVLSKVFQSCLSTPKSRAKVAHIVSNHVIQKRVINNMPAFGSVIIGRR